MSIEINKINNNINRNVEKSAPEICFRCPHCHKLYKTNSDVFLGGDADFDCTACTKSFSLKSERDSFGLYLTTELGAKSFSTCPKCTSLKPHNHDACPTCGVFASKYLEAQKSESPVLFELNQQWQKVLLNFDQDQYHQDFINKCHLKLALNFAFQKYSDLQKTIGFDSLCEKYINQIELRLEQQFKSKEIENQKAIQELAQQISTTQYIFIGLGTIGMVALIYNKYIPTFPNFNGFITLLTMAAFGIGLLSHGKSSFK